MGYFEPSSGLQCRLWDRIMTPPRSGIRPWTAMKLPRNPPPATRNHQTWSKAGLLRWVVILATLIWGGGAIYLRRQKL